MLIVLTNRRELSERRQQLPYLNNGDWSPSLKGSSPYYSREPIVLIGVRNLQIQGVTVSIAKDQHAMELFPRSFEEGLWARMTGPGKGRFVVQPIIATALGIRDGIGDAKQGNPPYVINVLFISEHKLLALKNGLKSIATPLTIGVVLDMVLQWVIFQGVFLLPAIIAGTILVALPYAIARGLSNRNAYRWYERMRA